MLINIFSQSNGSTLPDFNYYFGQMQLVLIGIAAALILLSSIYGAITFTKRIAKKIKGTATLPR